MPDPTEGLFDGLDRPRALPGPLRDRLEQQLLSAAGAPETVPLGPDLDERLRTTLTDPVAAELAGIDGPRALPPQLRAALAGQLTRRRRTAQRFLGAAAAVVLVVAVAVVLSQGQPGGHHRATTPAAAPAPSAVAGSEGAVGGIGGVGAGTSGNLSGGTTVGATGSAVGVPQPAPSAPAAGGHGAMAADATESRSAPVRSVSPNAGPVAGGTTVTLRGQGLSTATQVYFGGRAAASYTVVSDTTLRAVTPAARAETVDITVMFKNGASTRLSAAFSYLPRPSVTSVSPATGSSSGGTWVDISGGALSRETAVSFGGVSAARVEVVSDSQLRALSPQHDPGPVDITVTTPGGTSATNTGDRYTYLP